MLHRIFSQRITALFVILAVAILSAGQARAQVAGATLSGTVTDPSGAAIADARVVILNKATSVTRDATAGAGGFYSVPNLLPGVYDVTISAAGFSASKQSDVTLTVGAAQVLNVSLKIGEASQTVEVTASAAMVQLGSSVLSGEVEAATLRELPLNGRDWASLAALQPGVASVRTHPLGTQASRGLGLHMTISGGRPTQNSYRLDGALVNDYSNAGPGSVLGQNLGVDAIQEFTVLTSNYSAEYGFTSGGVINAITRSGTNTFHGSAFEFLRNDKLDAANFFDNANGRPKSTFRQNQFGGSGGGPIIKNKLFIFGDYEGIRYVKGIPTTNTTLSAAARTGIVTNLATICAGPPKCSSAYSGDVYNLPAGTITTANGTANFTKTQIDPIIQQFLAFYPLPTPSAPPVRNLDGTINPNVGLFSFPAINRAGENFYTFKGDYKISSKDSFFATFVHDKSNLLFPQAFNNTLTQNFSYRESIILEETHIFGPAFVNT